MIAERLRKPLGEMGVARVRVRHRDLHARVTGRLPRVVRLASAAHLAYDRDL